MNNQPTKAVMPYTSFLKSLVRNIYPLSLREKIIHRLLDKVNLPHNDIQLAFNHNIRMDLSVADVGHQSIMLGGFYELALTKFISKQAKSGGLLVDVGANYGYYSLLWAAQNPQNKVIAFEASPQNIPALTYNIEKNNLSPAITIMPKAVCDYSGSIHFACMNEEGQTGWGGISAQKNGTDIVVPCVTLDEYCHQNNITQIDFLKIDVEGADTMVLRGAKKLLHQKRIKVIAFEVNKQRMAALGIAENEALDLLHHANYQTKSLNQSEYIAWS